MSNRQSRQKDKQTSQIDKEFKKEIIYRMYSGRPFTFEMAKEVTRRLQND